MTSSNLNVKTMKILFCDNNLKSLLNFREEIIKYFISQGHEIYLVFPKLNSDCQLYANILQECACYPVDMQPSGMNIIKDIKYISQLFNIYIKIRPDIVFHYSIKPNIYGSVVSKLIGIKSIAMVAGLGYMFTGNSLGKKLGRLLYKIGLRAANYVITLNASNYETLLIGNYIRQEKSIIFTGGEGVNLSKYPYEENLFNETRFLMIARVLYDKGYREFIEAATIIKKEFPNVKVELLGPLDESSPMGVPREILEKDIQNEKINYLGVSNDVREIVLQDGVVILLPSYHEGLSRSLMEACAMGRPAIASNIPGCREAIDDGINGYLVSPKDAVSLANAMKRFILLPTEQKRAMSIAAYNKAKREFDIQNIIEKYCEVISMVLS